LILALIFATWRRLANFSSVIKSLNLLTLFYVFIYIFFIIIN
jgi:hypothetical protein